MKNYNKIYNNFCNKREFYKRKGFLLIGNSLSERKLPKVVLWKKENYKRKKENLKWKRSLNKNWSI